MPDLTPEQIRQLRERLALSRQDLAQQLGVAKRTVEFWEQGRGIPNRRSEKEISSMLEDTE